jgi:DNA-binding IclR family transcriptional regulator
MNNFATDRRLSIGARGVLAYLAASGITIFTARAIADRSPKNNLQDTARYLNELERLGYLAQAGGTYTLLVILQLPGRA